MKKRIIKVFRFTSEILGYFVSLSALVVVISFFSIFENKEKGTKEINFSNVKKILKKAKILKQIKKIKVIDGYKPGWSIDIDNEQYGWYHLTFESIENFPSQNHSKDEGWIKLDKKLKLGQTISNAIFRGVAFTKGISDENFPYGHPIKKNKNIPNLDNLYNNEYYSFILYYDASKSEILFLSKKKKIIFYINYPTW